MGTATLSGLRDRVETVLMDSSNLSWDTGTLDEAIRQALATINEAAGYSIPLTINGLDSATVTTLDDNLTALLVAGAAGYAGASRAVDRSEMANLNQLQPPALLEWSRTQLATFSARLAYVFTDLTTRSQIEITQARILAEADVTNQRTLTETARLTSLQRTSNSPHTPLTWDESDKNW